MTLKRRRSNATPLIRSPVMNLVVGALLSRLGGRELLRDKYDIKGAQADLYEQTSLAQYLALFEDASALLGDPFFGARLGSSSPPEDSLGPIGFLVLTAPSIKASLSEIAKYISFWQDATEVALRVQDDAVIWSYRILDEKLWPRRQDVEFTLAGTCAMIRTCAGQAWAPLEVHFEHSRPPGWQALRSIFRAPVLFDQPSNALVMNSHDVERPLQAQNAGFAPFVRRHIEEILGSEEADGIGERVRQLVSRDLGHTAVNLQTLAAQLGMPQRTLQRRLADEGSSVREIVREVRIQQAKSLLANGRGNINTVSCALGYSDATGFWRAFKSREGMSPAAFRERGRKSVVS
jgi:AraC-like DNA-binding protein